MFLKMKIRVKKTNDGSIDGSSVAVSSTVTPNSMKYHRITTDFNIPYLILRA